VLGQPGRDRIAAGLVAADAMVDRIAGRRVVKGPGNQGLSRLSGGRPGTRARRNRYPPIPRAGSSR
jgi:hypothetical protein